MSKAAELANLIGNINAGSPLGNKNLVHNGAMLVYQRSGTITLSGLTPNIDRFTAYKSNGGTQTVEHSTDGPEGFKNSLKVTNTGADSSVASGDRVAIIHRCEGQHVAHLEWGTSNAKTVTLSFYVKSSITGTHGGAFGNGSDNRAYPFTYTISSADTWERKTITVAGDTTGTWATDTGRSLQIAWGLGVGSTNSGTAGAWEAADRNSATGATTDFLTTVNATWFLTGVQLEIGQNATAFEHEPYSVTKNKCLRYYWRQGGGAVCLGSGTYYSSTNFAMHMDLPVPMRIGPTHGAEFNSSSFIVYSNASVDYIEGIGAGRNAANESGECYTVQWDSSGGGGTQGHGAISITQSSGQYVELKADL
jgi:hypothetical protein